MELKLGKMLFLQVLIFLCLSIYGNSYKILVHSPTITRSHMISTGRIADVLANDGHNVTVLELHYAFKPGSIDAVKKANLWKRPFDWPNRPKNFLLSEKTGDILHELGVKEYFQGNWAWHELMAEGCLAALQDGSLIEEIKREKYDVIMMEQLEFCAQSISHLAGIKTKIWLSSCPIMEHMSYALGLPAPYSYVPATMDNTFSDKMNIWQRFKNILLGSAVQYLFSYGAKVTRSTLNEKLGVQLPDLLQLSSDSQLIFTNIDEFLTFPRPLAANVINVGGLGLVEQKQEALESPFKEIVNKTNSKGLIYLAFGSVLPTHHLPLSFRGNLLKAFGNLKDYQFIMKISEEDKESREIVRAMPNVHLTTWAPQTSIMAHPNMKLAIVHGGYNSLLEAARFSVPLLLIPLANDAYSNSRLVERNKWGMYFEKKQLLHSHEEFQSAIEKMLNTPSYKQRAARTQQLFLNKPMSAEEKVKKYVRLLEMSNGELPELQSIAHKLSIVELYNLDVYFVLLLSISFAIFISVYILKLMLKRIWSRKVKEE